MDDIKKITQLQQNPGNPLQSLRQEADIDTDFFLKKWRKIDPLNEANAQHENDLYNKFMNIIKEEPTLFMEPQNLELSRDEQRELAYRQYKHYFTESSKVQPMNETLTNTARIPQFLSPIAHISQDVAVKITVSLQLAYKTIQILGTEKHSLARSRIEKGQDLSCFGLTELGHGSNVRGILTTATYDPKGKVFILNTPCKEAMKFWIGGAAKTSNSSVIWAQLVTNGEDHGPHAFIVPLRDRKNHLPLPGITIGDCGKKEGQDGIDNGFIMFDNVRIPKDNMLNRLSDVDDDGKFTSPIKSPDLRFGLSLGGLSTGRIILIGNMQCNIQQSLKIALRFSILRKQFGSPKEKIEQSLIDYQLHQYRLFPSVAHAWSFCNIENFIINQWMAQQKNIFKPEGSKLAELHALISVIKATTSWSCFRVAHECRLSCGGLGYSMHSKFATIMSACDINSTWEGDNNVLLQQTGKFLLDQYKAKMSNKTKQTVTVNWVTTDDVTEETCKAESIEDLLQPDTLKAIFEYRCNMLLQRAAMSLGQKMMDKSNDAFRVWNDHQVFGTQSLAMAYGECAMLHFDTQFLKKVDQKEKKENMSMKKDTKELLSILFNLCTLTRIEKDMTSWLEHGYFTYDHVEMIRNEIKNLLGKMKRFIAVLTDTMQPDDGLCDVMIAPANGNLYENIVKQLYSSPGVFERAHFWQDIVKSAPKL